MSRVILRFENDAGDDMGIGIDLEKFKNKPALFRKALAHMMNCTLAVVNEGFFELHIGKYFEHVEQNPELREVFRPFA